MNDYLNQIKDFIMPIPDFQDFFGKAIKGDVDTLIKWDEYHSQGHFSEQDIDYARENIDLCLQKNATNSHALTLRAYMYQMGQGEPPNILQAISLYKQAIALNNLTAMDNLGYIFQFGLGVEKNIEAAIALYEKAISLGDDKAMNSLGTLYFGNLDIPESYPKAIKCFEKAAALNNILAINNLALMYLNGAGMPKDKAQAIKLYERAISLGDVLATHSLASHYYDEKQYDKASKLYYQSYCVDKNSEAFSLLNLLAKEHNSAQAIVSLVFIALQNNQPDKVLDVYQSHPNVDILLCWEELLEACSKKQADSSLIQPLIDFITQNINLKNLLGSHSCKASLYNLAHYLTEYLPHNEELIYHVLQFLDEYKTTEQNLSELAYLHFKLALHQGDDENALVIYRDFLAKSDLLNADEYFRIGNAMACAGRTSLSIADIDTLLEACRIFYKGQEKGDKDCKRLLTKFVITIITLKKNSKNPARHVDSLDIDVDNSDQCGISNQEIKTFIFELEKIYLKEQLIEELTAFIKDQSLKFNNKGATSFDSTIDHLNDWDDKLQLKLAGIILQSLKESTVLSHTHTRELDSAKNGMRCKLLLQLLDPYMTHKANPVKLSKLTPIKRPAFANDLIFWSPSSSSSGASSSSRQPIPSMQFMPPIEKSSKRKKEIKHDTTHGEVRDGSDSVGHSPGC